MPPKLLPISIDYRERNSHVIGQYESGSKNSLVNMRALKMKKIEDEDEILQAVIESVLQKLHAIYRALER